MKNECRTSNALDLQEKQNTMKIHLNGEIFMLSAYMSIARSVAEDLRHIPEGGLSQSRLRIAYNA